MSGIGGTIVQGMAFGAGSEVGHQAVRAVMGGGGSSHSEPAPAAPAAASTEDPCKLDWINFNKCMDEKRDTGACQWYYDIMKECQQKHR